MPWAKEVANASVRNVDGNHVKKHVLLPLSSVQKRKAYHLNRQCINIVETLNV